MLLLNGDCIEQMQKLKDEGKLVDSVVTDPPYHLTSIVERYGKDGSAPAKDKDGLYQRQARGFMGKEWDGGDIAFRTDTWKLAYDLLKPGGYLLAFSASRNYHRMAVAIEDAGFEIRDQIMWIYGSGFPKSLNIGKAIDKRNGVQGDVIGTRKVTSSDIGQRSGWNHLNTDRGDYEYREIMNEYEGWGTALKPAHEPIVMARKPLEGTNIDNVLKYGTGGINIDGCRIEGNDAKYPDTNPDFRDQGKKSKEAIGIDKLSFGQVQNAERKKVVRKSRSGDGVWTNNNSGMKAEGTEFADADPRGRFPANVMHDGSDVVKDIFPNSKLGSSKPHIVKSNIEKYEGWGNISNKNEMVGYGDEGSAARYFYCPKVSKNERNNAEKNTHPTVKPVELMKYLCRLVTPKGGTVLDPFMGSGSTGMAAKDEGFDFIGIEKEKEYFDICQSRIKKTAPLMDFLT